MNWKPEVLHLGYHRDTLRWRKKTYGVITLSWNSLFSSFRWGYLGICLDWKEFIVGARYYGSTDHTLNIYPIPMVELVIHWHRKEKVCATKTTSSLSV